MNLIDGVAAAYAAVAAVRGSRRGVADEGYRLLRLLVSFLAGCGLFTLFDKLLDNVLASTLGDSRGVGFAAGLGAAFFLLRKLKASAVAFLQKQFAEKYNRLGGAAAGLVRALTATTALIAFLQMSPWIPGGRSAARDSLIGRVMRVFVPHNADTKEAAR